MKLSVTQYEREQLAIARQIVDELNANLARRGADFRFTITPTTETDGEPGGEPQSLTPS